MKRTTLMGISALAVAVALSSCSEDWGFNNRNNGTGRIAPVVGLDTEIVASASDDASSRADGDIELSQLSLRLTSADGSYSETWDSVDDFPLDKQFKVGSYTIEAFYGDADAEGYESPAFYGSQEIVVKDDATTSLGLTAARSNCRFAIKYTDAFTGYMSDWSATVKSAGEPIAYAKDETRPVYVKPGQVEISISVTKPNGLKATFALPVVEAKARYHYNVTVDVNNGNVGDGSLVVTFDENLDTEEVEINISNDVLSAPAPTVTADGFEPGTPVEMVSGLPSDKQMSMNIIAQAKIGAVMLETSSESLIAQGWPESIDLLKADAAQQAVLTNLGLKALGLWQNPDQMAVIDFSGVAKNIKVSTGGNSSVFTVTVKDALMRVTEPLALTVNVEAVNVELASAGEYLTPGEPLNIKLGFNGDKAALENNVTVEYLNPVSGFWNETKILSVSEPIARSTADYTISIATPAGIDDLKLRAKCADKVSGEVTIGTAPFEIAGNDNDVYATHAYVTVIGTQGHTAPALSQVSFIAKAADEDAYHAVSHSIDGNYANITGLRANTDYSIKASFDGMNSKVYAIHTEAATQLENGGMENWYSEKGSDNWRRYFPGESKETLWGTMNLLTTSFSGTRDYTAYCNFSGTRETDDKYSGNKAAIIETVGWGANAAQLWWTDSKHITVGELYLGSYNSSAQSPSYGISFTSRPSSVKFQYKYSARNSADYGYAFIKVLDANGRVIAEREINLPATNAYTEISFDLESFYGKGCAKAAQLQLTFKSSGHPDVTKQNNDKWLTRPPFSNLSDGRFTGSSLYIDDITLNY